MTTKILNIEGMTCASCAQTVEKATKNLEGVQEANVNLATEKLNISYDESRLSVEEIQSAVGQAGYKALTGREHKSFNIEGMTCASCAQTVEKATGTLNGVISSSVNLATEKMTVDFDPAFLTVSDITQAVADSGYAAHEDLDSMNTVDDSKVKKEKNIHSMWKRFVASAIVTVPLLYISMGHMAGLPLPSVIDPMMNPGIFALLQLILTLPVMFFGRKFFTVGFKTLSKGHPNMDSLVALGTGAAFIYSFGATIAIWFGYGDFSEVLYYESAAVILTLITLGKYLEVRSKGKTSEAIEKLMGLAPKTALVVRDGKKRVFLLMR